MKKSADKEIALSQFMLYAFEKLGKTFEDGRDSLLGARGFYTLYVLGTYAPKTMTELGEACNMKKQQTTNVVDNLIELGLAQRLYNQRDRRVIQIAITDSGQDFLEQQVANGTHKLLERINALPEEQQKIFFETIEKLNPILADLS